MKRGGYSATVRGSNKSPNNRATAEQVFGYATIPRNFRGNVNCNYNTSVAMNQEGRSMSTFNTEVIDGMVMNRFRRPNELQYHPQPQNQVMNMNFYRAPTSPRTPSPGYFSQSSFDNIEMSSPYHNSSNPPALPDYPPSSRKPPPENKPSLLLNREENLTIFEILGKGRQSLATAVVQLLVTTPDQTQWMIKETGVVCLVRDTAKKSYFIQVFSLRTKSMVFRQEIYNQFDYSMPEHFFLTFEGDSSQVGINFADPTEAANFREVLDSKLQAKRQRRNEREQHRRSRLIADNHQHQEPPAPVSNHVPPPSLSNGTSTVSTTYTFPTSMNLLKSKKNNKAKDKGKGKLTLRKEDIGKPMDFRHVQHVGWDPNKGFDLTVIDSSLKTFFEKAGVSANELKDENTRQFIYNFIEEQGGVEAIKRMADGNSISRPPAPPPPPSLNSAPPPVPNRQAASQKPAAPPPPPSRPVPPVPGYNNNGSGPPAPPPPPMRTSSTNIVERPQNNHHQSPNYNQSNNGPARPPPPPIQSSPRPLQSNGPIPPPPPPPPPMPVIGAPPPPPPPPIMDQGYGDQIDNSRSVNTPKAPPPVDERSQLMMQIQKGVQLKKTEPVESQPKPKGGLADCLNQIQKGVGLKPVVQTAKEPQTLDAMDGLAGALARALAERSKAINPDSSSSDDEDEEVCEDDEWE